MLRSGNARIGGMMKKIFIVLTFIFISLLGFADNVNVGVRIPLEEPKIILDFNMKLMMGVVKVENNPKYKKLVSYVDENLSKKGRVKYSANINLKNTTIEIFSENGELLYEEKLPKEFTELLNHSMSVVDNKKETKNFFEEMYGKATYVLITKNNGKLKLFVEQNMGTNKEKMQVLTETVLKRELTENEKKELLILKNYELLVKYKTYIESEISKVYVNNKLTMVQEFKNLTETSIVYIKNNESIKKEIKYTDNTLSNGTMKSYKNDKLMEEIIFENSMPKLQKLYYENGKLETEIPFKNDEVNGEVKIYYENGKIKEITPVKDGKKEGIGREYSETGKIITEILYKDDEEVKKIK